MSFSNRLAQVRSCAGGCLTRCSVSSPTAMEPLKRVCILIIRHYYCFYSKHMHFRTCTHARTHTRIITCTPTLTHAQPRAIRLTLGCGTTHLSHTQLFTHHSFIIYINLLHSLFNIFFLSFRSLFFHN